MKLSSRGEATIFELFPAPDDMLSVHDRVVVETEAAALAEELKRYMSAAELAAIKASTGNFAPELRHLARDIRTEFELWDPDHHVTAIWRRSPATFFLGLIEAECDNHPCHPDNFSAYVITKLQGML